MHFVKMKERSSRRCKRRTVMPPTLRYRSSSNSNNRAKKRPGARMRMRAWLEDLLDQELCRGLAWKNKREKIFTIVWRHASSHGFEQSEHGDVFYRWAQHTGKNKGKEQSNHSSYKSNFRCALHSLKDCIELTNPGDKKGEKASRTFQFIDPSHPKYKKKNSVKKVKVEGVEEEEVVETNFYEEESDQGDYLTSSSSSSPTSSSLGVPPPQQTCVQALFSGKNIPIQGSTSDSTNLLSDEHLLKSTAHLSLNSGSPSSTAVPNLNMLLDSGDQPTQFSMGNLDSSARAQTKNFMRIETNSEGITTIILPDSSNASAGSSESQDSQRSYISLLSVNPAQSSHSDTDGTYNNFSSHLNTKLTCGGNVKIKKINQETLPLSLPIPFPYTTHTPSDMDVASNMEIQDIEDEGNHFFSEEYDENNPENVIIESIYPDNTDEQSIITELTQMDSCFYIRSKDFF